MSNLIYQSFVDADKQSYKGPLDRYHYNNFEFKNLLNFLREIPNSNRIWLVDSTDLKLELPPDGYDTYIIGCFGELANYEFLSKINEIYADRKLICLSSQNFNYCSALTNFRIFYIEYLHKLISYFPQKQFTNLQQRKGLHSILTRRMEPHRYLFTAALLSKYPDTNYSLVRLRENNILTFEKFIKELENILCYKITEEKLNKTLKWMLDQNPKILPGHQWSLNNTAYSDSKLHWVNESMFLSLQGYPTAYLTEKSIKPIVSKTPFVLLGQTHVYDRLTKLNFNCGEEIFSIKFDQRERDADRIDLVFQLMDKLNPEFINDNLEKFQQLADYNYNYYYNGFVQHCDSLNNRQFADVIEYINS